MPAKVKRSKRKVAAGPAELRWSYDPEPVPVPPPASFEAGVLRYGWDAIRREEGGPPSLRAVVLTGLSHAVVDVESPRADPRARLADRVAHRYAGGWSQGSRTCYATPREALVALRLRTQRSFAERLAAIDRAIEEAGP